MPAFAGEVSRATMADRAAGIFARHRRLSPPALAAVLGLLVCVMPTVAQQSRTPDAKALIAEGIKLAREGNHARAAVVFQQAVMLYPADFDARYNFALALYNAGSLAGAEVQFGLALELQPDSAEAHRGLGLTLNALHRYAEAAAHLRAAVAGLPKDAAAQAALGRAYLGAGNPRKALEPLKAALKLQPDSAGVAYDLGRAAEACRDLPLALSSYSRSLSRKPDSLPSALGLARTALELKEPLRAVEALRPFVETTPTDPAFWRLLMRGYDGVGLAEEAMRARLTLADLAQPAESAQLRAQAAERLIGLNRCSEALLELQLAAVEDPANTEVLLLMARCHRALGDRDREIETLRTAAARQPQDTAVSLGLATALAGAGSDAEALSALERALSVDPANETALRMAADAAGALGRLQDREQYLRRVLALSPRSFRDRMALVDCLVERDQTAQALLEAHEALLAPSPPAEAFIKVAQLAERIGSREIAIDQWKALALKHPDRTVQGALEAGRLLVASHRIPEAVEIYSRALAREPDAPDLELALGRAWQAAGQDEKALPILERLVASKPELTPARAALAESLAWLGRDDEAKAHAERVLSSRKLDAASCRAVATVYERAGQPADAWEALERLIPDRAPLSSALSILQGLYTRAGSGEEGGWRLSELSAANPGHPEIGLTAAALLARAGHTAEAQEILLRVSAQPAWFQRALRQLSRMYLSAGAPDKAIWALRRLLEPDPNHVWVIVALLELEQRPDMAADASPALQRLADSIPGSPAFWAAAAELAAFLGKTTQTIPRMRAVTTENPGDPGPATGLAALHLLDGDARAADLAISVVPELLRQDRALLSTHARARLELGDSEGALRLLERVVRTGLAEPEDHLLLARIQHKASRHELRLWHLSRALILDPVSEQAREGIEDCIAGHFVSAETVLAALSDVYYHHPDSAVVQDLARQVALDMEVPDLVAEWQGVHQAAAASLLRPRPGRVGRAGLTREHSTQEDVPELDIEDAIAP